MNSLQITSHCQGEILNPIIMYKGIAPSALEEKYRQYFMFSDTEYGIIDQKSLVTALSQIEGYLYFTIICILNLFLSQQILFTVI